MQFSNDVRVELPLEPLDCAAFHTLMASMVRTYECRNQLPEIIQL